MGCSISFWRYMKKTKIELKVKNFNEAALDPILLKQLRKLTLFKYSGMNFELNRLEKDAAFRRVDCQVLLAYKYEKLVGWALYSKENSNFYFCSNNSKYENQNGILFEVFVDEKWRRMGIGTELLRLARRKARGIPLCIDPWDDQSQKFYHSMPKLKKNIL